MSKCCHVWPPPKKDCCKPTLFLLVKILKKLCEIKECACNGGGEGCCICDTKAENFVIDENVTGEIVDRPFSTNEKLVTAINASFDSTLVSGGGQGKAMKIVIKSDISGTPVIDYSKLVIEQAGNNKGEFNFSFNPPLHIGADSAISVLIYKNNESGTTPTGVAAVTINILTCPTENNG